MLPLCHRGPPPRELTLIILLLGKSGHITIDLISLLGPKYRSALSRDGTCAISSSKDSAPISRLLKQSRDGADPTKDDFLLLILKRFFLLFRLDIDDIRSSKFATKSIGYTYYITIII